MGTRGSSWGQKENKCHTCLKEEQDEDPVNCRLVRFTLFPWNVIQQVILRTTCKHMKDKRGNVSSDWEFTKGKSCLNNLKAFYNETIASVYKRRGADTFYLYLSKAFNNVSLNILVDILMEQERDKCTGRWVETWLNCWASRAASEVWSPDPVQSLELSSVLEKILFFTFINDLGASTSYTFH